LEARKASRSRARLKRRSTSRARPREMIEEATVDAYGESEQIGGFYTTIVDHLAVPFDTTLLGIPVRVNRGLPPLGWPRLNTDPRSASVAAVRSVARAGEPIPIPRPWPRGVWIEVYCPWVRADQSVTGRPRRRIRC
jgi:hypothetical protein